MDKTIKHVCKCENCGNEAEMNVTCSLDDLGEAKGAKGAPAGKKPKKVKGTGVCTQCGNEADMWIEI